jgi:dihydroorotase-like cyclic amidohydrolase
MPDGSIGPDDNFAVESRGALAGGCTTALNYVQFGPPSLMDSYRMGLDAAASQSMINVLFHGCLMDMGQVAEIPTAVSCWNGSSRPSCDEQLGPRP